MGMKFVIKKKKTGLAPRTHFAIGAVKTLDRLVGLEPGARRPIRFFGKAVRAADTRWGRRYPNGIVYHVGIRQPGIVPHLPDGNRCAAEVCGHQNQEISIIPDGWPKTKVPICLAVEHHADLVLPDDPRKEEMGRIDERVMVHATTPVFHPNVGKPRDLYCLAIPGQTWTIEQFLNQFIFIAAWHRDVVNLGDVRNQHARRYYEALCHKEAWPALLPRRSVNIYGSDRRYLLG